MSELRIYSENDGRTPLGTYIKHADIARELGAVGVRFEQWEASQPVAPGARSTSPPPRTTTPCLTPMRSSAA